MWGPSRTTSRYATERREKALGRYGWLLLPIAMVIGLVVDGVTLGLVAGNGLGSHSMRMYELLFLWTFRPGLLVVLLQFTYVQSIYGELKERVGKERSGEGAAAPWLLRMELFSIASMAVGVVVYFLFFFSFNEGPWGDSVAATLGFYTPLAWFLAILAIFTAPIVLGVARFAEAFAFTGDRGADEDERDVLDRFQ